MPWTFRRIVVTAAFVPLFVATSPEMAKHPHDFEYFLANDLRTLLRKPAKFMTYGDLAKNRDASWGAG